MQFSLAYLISLLLFAAAFRMYQKIARLRVRQAKAEIAQAIIHEKEVADGKYGAYRYYLHYGFEVAGRPVSGKAEVSAAMHEQSAVGSTVTVMYETHNPDVNYLQKIFFDRLSSYQALVLLLGISGIVVPLVF